MKRLWKIFTTPEFDVWYLRQTEKHKQQIRARLRNIELSGHFGTHKAVSQDSSICELKWENGRRIYYACPSDMQVLLILGGNKNGQNKDISKAKKIFIKYKEDCKLS